MDLAVPPSLLALVDELEAKRVMTVNHWFALIYGLIMALYISWGGGWLLGGGGTMNCMIYFLYVI